ncbi:MAG: ATP-binding protein [Myxococcota bacterium]|nr:ATP-binding protein [Myxococcota bacterium]
MSRARAHRQTDALHASRQDLLAECIRLVIFATMVALIITPFVHENLNVSVLLMGFGPFLASYLTALVLVRSGRLAPGAWIFMIGTFIGQLGAVFVAQGYQGQALVSFVNLVLIAGFTMGSVTAVVVTIICVFMVCLYNLVDLSPLTGFQLVEQNSASKAVTLATTIFTTGGLVVIGMRHFNRGMERLEAASVLATKSREIAEVAQRETQIRAQSAHLLAELGGRLIELKTTEAVARLCCETVQAFTQAEAVCVVDHEGGCVAAVSPRQRVFQQPQAPLHLDTARSLTMDESRALFGFVSGEELNGFGMPIETPFARLALVLVGVKGRTSTGANRSFLDTTAEFLGAAMGRVVAEERLIRSQKMDVVDRLSAWIAHDLNNYLMSIVTGLRLVERRLERGQPVKKHLTQVQKTSDSASALMRKLTNFTQARRRSPEPVELAKLVASLPLVLNQSRKRNVAYRVIQPDTPLWVMADPVDIEQIALNLILNAFDAVHQNGSIQIEVFEHDDRVVLVVEDNGHGMDESVQTRIFEPFFTTRQQGGGSGLGLAMVDALVRGCEAEIVVNSRPSEGTRFEISFPQHRPGAQYRRPESRPPQPGRLRRILVVDDEDVVRTTLAEVLRDLDYLVFEASNGEDAWRKMNAKYGYDLVLTDAVMPELGGYALIDRMRQHGLETPVILMTGYLPESEASGRERYPVPELRKPFSPEKLSAMVEAALISDSA